MTSVCRWISGLQLRSELSNLWISRLHLLRYRLVDSTKFTNFNMLVPLGGRYFRLFDSSGFITGTLTGESLAGADGTKVRFKTVYPDIKSVASVTVNGTPTRR
jgi:hypothetical protein